MSKSRRYTLNGTTLTREQRSEINRARFQAGLPTLGQVSVKALAAEGTGIKARTKKSPAQKAARKAASTGFMKAYFAAKARGYTGTMAEFGPLFEMQQIAS